MFLKLDGAATSISSFLRRTITEVDGGLMLTPGGTSVSKVVSAFEKAFGQARVQKIPCDGSIQLEDNSEKLSPVEASSYRSIVGLCLYGTTETRSYVHHTGVGVFDVFPNSDKFTKVAQVGWLHDERCGRCCNQTESSGSRRRQDLQ